MFERSADWLVGTAPVAGMAALVALAELLKAAADPQDSAARSTDSSAASGSDDTDRRQAHATAPQVPRQFDMFANASETPDVQPPP